MIKNNPYIKNTLIKFALSRRVKYPISYILLTNKHVTILNNSHADMRIDLELCLLNP